VCRQLSFSAPTDSDRCHDPIPTRQVTSIIGVVERETKIDRMTSRTGLRLAPTRVEFTSTVSRVIAVDSKLVKRWAPRGRDHVSNSTLGCRKNDSASGDSEQLKPFACQEYHRHV
jgi:hypothetical protein